MNRPDLEAWFHRHLPLLGELIDVEEIEGGWESDIHLVTTISGPRVVVRSYVTGRDDVADREFAGLKLLHASGYPVPEPLAVEPDDALLGRPFLVMRYVERSADREWAEVIDHGLSSFVGLLADLHRVAWEGLWSGPPSGPADVLERWQPVILDRAPGFAPVLEWLGRQLPPTTGLAVVHWDFHAGNVLVAHDGTTTVIDWTQVTVTDPRFDVAWTELLIAMAIDHPARRAFRAEYERKMGPLEDMEWFAVASAVKRLFTVSGSLEHGPEALGMRPEAAERMRADLPTLQVPYATVVETSGHEIPEIERLLNP